MRFAFSVVCLFLLLFTSSESVYAQSEGLDEYRVEILVLRNLNPVYGTEIFPLEFSIEEEALPAMRFGAVPADQLELGKMADRLASSNNFRVLSHFGWQQPGFPREEAKRKVVLRNSANGESMSGDIVLTRERYLRLHLKLTFQIDGQTFQFNAHRRMISRQVHYFDHPYFGVIAKITPLD